MRTRLFASAILTASLILTSLTACDLGSDNGKPQIVTAFYPLEFIAKAIGGDHISVTNLTKPGAEPHDVELKPKQVASVVDADLVVYLKGFQPEIDAAVKEHNPDKGFDTAKVEKLTSGYVPSDEHKEEAGHDELASDGDQKDPHVWLDPLRLATIADALADRLATTDPDHKQDYRDNAKRLRGQLETLDSEYTTGLQTCDTRTFVVSHNAFGYLAARYDLNQAAISGLEPEGDPTPGRVAEVADYARANNVKVIFFETLVSPKVAETIATQVGARTEVLDPIEGIKKGSGHTYLTLMRDNLKQLRDALGCR